jgi:RHS repeat-associated protein
MCLKSWKLAMVIAFCLFFTFAGKARAASPTITTLSPTFGAVGASVTITGTNFGTTQGSSTVTFNGTTATPTSWGATSIVVPVPTGTTSGNVVVTVGGIASNGVNFIVPNIPTGWTDSDVGSVGAAGYANFASLAFTVNGSGPNIDLGVNDEGNFVYQSLSGDGTIVARIVSVVGSNQPQAGVMIRETLNTNSANAFVGSSGNTQLGYLYFWDRPSTGASSSSSGGSAYALPYWVKLNRSGNTFTGYQSPDGVNWTQIGSSLAVTMAQNVYIGLAVSSHVNTSLVPATFDNVSIDTPTAPDPVISSVSATTGSVGSQIVLSGTGFGATQGNSLVALNAAPVTVNSWSDSSITITIPTGATSGPMLVSVAPTMNDSNYVDFTVTSQPLPSPWLDQDVGLVGVLGSVTYSGSTFTMSAAGPNADYGHTDAFHFAYQTLSGNGTVVARVVSVQGGNGSQAGVMIRESLDANAANAFVASYGYTSSASFNFWDRASEGASPSLQSGSGSHALPYWLKLVRSGSSFTGYKSVDGVTWTQIGTSVTIPMAQNVYVGLAANSFTSTSLATSTFDNVSLTFNPPGSAPVITDLSPSVGGPASTVTISGENFGATQGSSVVNFNGVAAASILSWRNSEINAVAPVTVTTGPVTVAVNSVSSNNDYTFTVVNPFINYLTPTGGPAGGQVTLNGSGFGATQGNSSVQLNGVVANVSSWSDTSVTIAIPYNVNSGPITLTRSGVTSNAVQFTVTGQLSVTSVSPTVGPVGSTVTIKGTGFGSTQSSSTVSFNGTTATSITSWSSTQIVAIVPSGTYTGPVSVTVASITANGPSFEVNATTQLTDSLNHQSTYTSVLVGGKWAVSNSTGSGCSTCTMRGTIQNTFDTLGNVLSTEDALNHTTSYTYDANDNVKTVVTPTGGGTTTYTYNSFGEALTVTDPLSFVTTNTYDAKGNLLSVTAPPPDSHTPGSLTQFAYDSKGELTTITDPLNNVTTLTYTSAGLIATVTDAQHNVTTYQYDAHGNRTSVTDSLQKQTTFAYDAGDRLTTITYPDTTTSTFAYDYRGRRTSVTDQNGKQTTYAYDDEDRLTSITDAANNVTSYGYDTEGNLLTITDANNHTTTFTYDAFGRVTQTAFPSTLTESYGYDAVGNLTTKTDRKSQTVTYTYDQLNRLTQKSYPDTTTVAYTYDDDSRLTEVVDPTGTYQFTLDNMGRLKSTTTSYAFLGGRNFQNSYTYDAASNRTGFTDPENGTSTYIYDTLNRLSTITPPTAITSGNFGFSYDALSRRTQMTRPNGVNTNYSYDNLSHLLSVLHQNGGVTIDGASYTVDNAGNRTAKTDQLANVTSNYGYDAIYELLSTMQGANTTESYTYDPVGNRLTSLGAPYTNNTSNELTAKTGVTYTYDNNGNTFTKTDSTGTTAYAWDFENRLTSVTLPGSGGTVSFKYDPFGRRIEKTTASTTSIYAYDNDNLIEETNSSGVAVARYSQGLNIDEPLAMLRSATTSFYQADGLGSVTSLSNGAGSIANTYAYDSFGKVTNSTGSLVNPFQYTAREVDSETSLYYYRARYYDSAAGRFLSEDPLQFEGGIDFYTYALNNPTSMIDPIGEKPCSIQVKCRGVKSGKLDVAKVLTLGILSYQHCYIATTDEGGVGHILSAGPSPTDPHKMTSGDDPFSKEPNLGKDHNAPIASCPNGPTGNCGQAQCLANVAMGFQNSFPSYDFRGKNAPNSNSFVDYATRSCGITTTFPKQAKGWDYFRKQGLP